MKRIRLTNWSHLIFKLGFILLLLVSSFSCKKNETTIQSKLSGVVLFAVGDVQSGNKKIKAGDLILESERIQTGKNSTCDIQIRESDSGIVMRIKSESIFELKLAKSEDKKAVNAVLTAGKMMVNVPGKLKAGESFSVITPTSTAGIRGTKFEVEVVGDGSTNYSVTEGRIAAKVYISELEKVPKSIQEKSVTISALNEAIDSEEKIIEAGQKTAIEKAQTDKILNDFGLRDSIVKAQYNSGYTPNQTEVQDSIAALDKSQALKTQEGIQAVKTNAVLKIQTEGTQNLQAKLKEYEELIAIEKKKLETYESVNLAVQERNEKYDEILVKRIEEITGKSFETLILKNGKKVRGAIFLEGNQYYVITPDGQKTFKEEEVESVEL
ncbi:MAG TPA: FecR family protein [Leptospiraceae bacterium]|nr:FecR family protein [Leptospiraceae bacterium]HMW07189.1 FecR family protein [Leptospiraceae bacterium]HMX33782.1 FecR family protein [Leptospiraceae bacterium]HMY32805.1 FecR family protein [Leptospiraceae bacterium]HMZ67099.1 FecR family protein [Leptospiraceae bacterium]